MVRFTCGHLLAALEGDFGVEAALAPKDAGAIDLLLIPLAGVSVRA